MYRVRDSRLDPLDRLRRAFHHGHLTVMSSVVGALAIVVSLILLLAIVAVVDSRLPTPEIKLLFIGVSFVW